MMTIPALIEELLQHEKDRRLAERSLKDARRYLGYFRDWCTQRKLEVIDLTPQLLLDFLQQRFGHDEKGSLRKMMTWNLRKFGEFLAFHGYLEENPAEGFKHPKQNRREKLPEYLTQTQMRQLLTHIAHEQDLLSLTVVSLFLNTGLRPGDMVSVSRFQFFPRLGYISGMAKGYVRKHTPLSDTLIELLQSYLATRTDRNRALLVDKQGRPLKIHHLREIVKKAGRSAGLEITLTPRILRHTFATHLCDRHGSILSKALLGHGSHRNTQVYVHLSPRRFRQCMNVHPYNSEAHLHG